MRVMEMGDGILEIVVRDRALYVDENHRLQQPKKESRIHWFRVWLGDRIPWKWLRYKVYPSCYGRCGVCERKVP